MTLPSSRNIACPNGTFKINTPSKICNQSPTSTVFKLIFLLLLDIKYAVSKLKKGGRIAIISFHSLEDRIVKNTFKELSTSCICPPDFPICVCNHKASLKIISNHPITATEKELEINSRSASAKLRVAEKI